MSKPVYEVWGLGYNSEGFAIDADVLLGSGFSTPEPAIEHAKKFYDLECVFGKGKVSEALNEGDYMVIRVEQCLVNKTETICEEVIYENTLYQA